MSGRIQPIRSWESRCVFCGTPQVERVVNCIPRKFPGVHYGLQVFPPNARQRAAPSLISLSLDFVNANQIILSNSAFSSLNLRKNLLLEAEYFMQTLRNLRNSDWSTGTVEKKVLLRKTFVTSAPQNNCSEVNILNELQLEQSRDNLLIRHSVGN